MQLTVRHSAMMGVTVNNRNKERRLILPRLEGQAVWVSNRGLDRYTDCCWVERW